MVIFCHCYIGNFNGIKTEIKSTMGDVQNIKTVDTHYLTLHIIMHESDCTQFCYRTLQLVFIQASDPGRNNCELKFTCRYKHIRWAYFRKERNQCVSLRFLLKLFIDTFFYKIFSFSKFLHINSML